MDTLALEILNYDAPAPAVGNEIVMDIATVVRRRFDHGDPLANLFCMCGVVSAELSEELRKAHIPHHIEYIDSVIGGHVFIRIGDKILDLTARQFSTSLPGIVYAPDSELGKEWFWYEKNDDGFKAILRRFDTAADLIAAQTKWHWPPAQINQRIAREFGI